MSVQVRKFSFESKFDQVPIRGICMVPDNPIGIIQMVHGMCEHKQRYVSFMQNLANRGYIVLMHDNRGHGESLKRETDIGYCYGSKEVGFVGDIHRISTQIKAQYPGLPLILYGHSMGSLAVRAYLRNHDDEIDGLIIAGSPSYNDFVPAGLWLLKLLKRFIGERYRSSFVQKLVVGNFEQRFRAENRKYAWLAANETVGEEFAKDSLCTFTYTVNGFETLLNLQYITYRAIGYQMENEKLPILFVSGEEDPVYINESKWNHAIKRMRELGYDDIQEIRYSNMRHEIHNEKENEKVFDDMDAFCKKVVDEYEK